LQEAFLHKLITEAKKSDQLAREELILAYRSQITAAACKICGRPLDWNNDDELSIGLIAFNEAIDSYDASKDKSFWNYAQLVIHNRLVDYFRREAQWKQRAVVPIDNEIGIGQLEYSQAVEKFEKQERAWEHAEMMARFQAVLLEYKITLDALVKDSPSHKDTKFNLMKVAHAVRENPDLLKKLKQTKQLPIKELMLQTGLSRKVLDTGRRYIIALILILVHDEFSGMRSFIKFHAEEGR
jgi:RNA polymerase sigma factor